MTTPKETNMSEDQNTKAEHDVGGFVYYASGVMTLATDVFLPEGKTRTGVFCKRWVFSAGRWFPSIHAARSSKHVFRFGDILALRDDDTVILELAQRMCLSFAECADAPEDENGMPLYNILK